MSVVELTVYIGYSFVAEVAYYLIKSLCRTQLSCEDSAIWSLSVGIIELSPLEVLHISFHFEEYNVDTSSYQRGSWLFVVVASGLFYYYDSTLG